MLEFEILVYGYYRPDQLEIAYNRSLRMPSSPSIRAWMATLWGQKLGIARDKISRSSMHLCFVS